MTRTSPSRREKVHPVPEVTPLQKRRPPRVHRRPNPIVTSGLVLLRFSIVGVGLGGIAGTLMTAIDPERVPLPRFESIVTPIPSASPSAPSPQPSLTLKTPLTALNQKIQAIAAKYPKLQLSALFIDLDNGSYAGSRENIPYPAASTIKIPILVAFFEDVDAGKIRLDEPLVASKDVLGGGSGDIQYLGENQVYSALETATKMIVISDNTATNMLVKRLGGKNVLNQRFQKWGLTRTVINNALPDLEGTNTTSAKDLATILGKVNQGELLGLKSRDRLRDILRETRTRTLLPQGLEKGASIVHKTGDIGKVLGDAGIVDMPDGKRYLGAVLVRRPHNDPDGRTLIQQLSRTVYQHFKWYRMKPATPKPNPETRAAP